MMGDAAMRPSVIRQFAPDVAAIVASEHERNPMGELVVWLHMALRREASVGEIYGVWNLDHRLDQVRAPAEIVGLLRTTISNIWAQEKSHAAYLKAVLIAVAHPTKLRQRLGARLDTLLGAIEGQVLLGRTSPSHLQQVKATLMLAIGRRVQNVPDFVSSLSALSFREFCRLNAELEITAVHGYERMLTLLEEVATHSSLQDDTTLAVDIGRMLRDERFHNRAFAAMQEWFDPARARRGSSDGNSLRTGMSRNACAARLAAIAEVYGSELATFGAGVSTPRGHDPHGVAANSHQSLGHRPEPSACRPAVGDDTDQVDAEPLGGKDDRPPNVAARNDMMVDP